MSGVAKAIIQTLNTHGEGRVMMFCVLCCLTLRINMKYTRYRSCDDVLCLVSPRCRGGGQAVWRSGVRRQGHAAG